MVAHYTKTIFTTLFTNFGNNLIKVFLYKVLKVFLSISSIIDLFTQLFVGRQMLKLGYLLLCIQIDFFEEIETIVEVRAH